MEDAMRKKFSVDSKKFKELVGSRGLSLNKISERTYHNRSWLSRLTSNKFFMISDADAQNIADVLGCRIQDFSAPDEKKENPLTIDFERASVELMEECPIERRIELIQVMKSIVRSSDEEYASLIKRLKQLKDKEMAKDDWELANDIDEDYWYFPYVIEFIKENFCERMDSQLSVLPMRVFPNENRLAEKVRRVYRTSVDVGEDDKTKFLDEHSEIMNESICSVKSYLREGIGIGFEDVVTDSLDAALYECASLLWSYYILGDSRDIARAKAIKAQCKKNG